MQICCCFFKALVPSLVPDGKSFKVKALRCSPLTTKVIFFKCFPRISLSLPLTQYSITYEIVAPGGLGNWVSHLTKREKEVS